MGEELPVATIPSGELVTVYMSTDVFVGASKNKIILPFPTRVVRFVGALGTTGTVGTVGTLAT